MDRILSCAFLLQNPPCNITDSAQSAPIFHAMGHGPKLLRLSEPPVRRPRPLSPLPAINLYEFAIAMPICTICGQPVGLTRESRDCYTQKRTLLCGFQQ